MKPILLHILNVESKHAGKTVFENLDFSIRQGEQWAIIGQSEYLKSQFLQLITGKVPISKGAIHHLHATDYLQSSHEDGIYRSPHDLVSYVTLNHHFRNKSNLHAFYYQQRFNSMDADDADTVLQFLENIKPKHGNIIWTPEKTMELFGLNTLADKSVIMLSNGETRRLMLAAALVRNPVLLLLEKPLLGLDVQTRARFGEILQAIIDSGIQVVISTFTAEISSCITHVAVLEGKGIIYAGAKEQVDLSRYSQPTAVAPSSVSNDVARLLTGVQHDIQAPVILMKNVTVRYGSKVILQAINWQVNPGEAWALQGHNGAGKSTLLSLVNGDNPQAYGNDISLFGRKRGSGESIWDIKKNIGYVSPELHQYFPKNQSCLHVVISGLYDTIGLFRNPDDRQRGLAMQWLEFFGLGDIARKMMWLLGPDQQRLCLLARALIKNPRLLILDEPVQGLDTAQRDFFKTVIDEIHRAGKTTIIYVSHYADDIPSCVNKYIRLEGGKIAGLTP